MFWLNCFFLILCKSNTPNPIIRTCFYQNRIFCFIQKIPQEKISIFGLATILVEKSEFSFNEKEYYKYLEHLVHMMNHKLEGLYVETEEQKQKWERHRVGWNAKGKPFKVQHSIGYFTLDGKSTWVFYSSDKTQNIELAQITAYEDGTFELDI